MGSRLLDYHYVRLGRRCSRWLRVYQLHQVLLLMLLLLLLMLLLWEGGPPDPHTHIGIAAYGKPAARLSLRAARPALQPLVESLSAASGPVADAAAVAADAVAVGSLGGCQACLEVLVADRLSEAAGW